MNNTTKPGAVLPPANFFVGCNDYDRFVCDREYVEALFSDDETIGDAEEYFDGYAFSVWNDDQHNERSEPMTERCYCHRYNRYCGLCRPY